MRTWCAQDAQDRRFIIKIYIYISWHRHWRPSTWTGPPFGGIPPPEGIPPLRLDALFLRTPAIGGAGLAAENTPRQKDQCDPAASWLWAHIVWRPIGEDESPLAAPTFEGGSLVFTGKTASAPLCYCISHKVSHFIVRKSNQI